MVSARKLWPTTEFVSYVLYAHKIYNEIKFLYIKLFIDNKP